MKTETHYEGQRWNYRGFIIWCFDGYYDIHKTVDGQPIAEGISTAAEARMIINQERISNAFASGNFTVTYR